MYGPTNQKRLQAALTACSFFEFRVRVFLGLNKPVEHFGNGIRYRCRALSRGVRHILPYGRRGQISRALEVNIRTADPRESDVFPIVSHRTDKDSARRTDAGCGRYQKIVEIDGSRPRETQNQAGTGDVTGQIT